MQTKRQVLFKMLWARSWLTWCDSVGRDISLTDLTYSSTSAKSWLCMCYPSRTQAPDAMFHHMTTDHLQQEHQQCFYNQKMWISLTSLFSHQTSALLSTFRMSCMDHHLYAHPEPSATLPQHALASEEEWRNTTTDHLEPHCFDESPMPGSNQLWWWPYMLL